MAGHSRSKNGVASARLWPGHPRLSDQVVPKTWMHATSAGMTRCTGTAVAGRRRTQLA